MTDLKFYFSWSVIGIGFLTEPFGVAYDLRRFILMIGPLKIQWYLRHARGG